MWTLDLDSEYWDIRALNYGIIYPIIFLTRNVGQCPTWWPPCQIQAAPSVQRRKVWLMPTSRVPCRAVTLRRRETHWNLQGCLKLANRSQPVVGWSSPYYEDMWRRYCCLTNFFQIANKCLRCKDMARQNCAMVPRWRFFASCIYSEPRAARFRPAF